MVLIKPIDTGFFPFYYESEEIHRLSASSLPVLTIMTIGFIIFPFIYYLFYKNRKNQKLYDRTMFGIGIFLLLFEGFKQLTYAKMFHYLPGQENFGHYYLNVLPLQLCSMHMFLCPLIPFLKGRAKQDVSMFIGLYAFIGGIAVLLGGLDLVLGGFQNQDGIWFGDWGLVVHTLVWHVILMNLGAIVFGYYHLGSLKVKESIRLIRVPWIICMVFMVVSQFLNVLLPYCLNFNKWVEGFNLWNFSWIYGFNLPVLKEFCRTDPAWIGGIIGTILYGGLLYLGALVVLLVIITFKNIMMRFKGVNQIVKDVKI